MNLNNGIFSENKKSGGESFKGKCHVCGWEKRYLKECYNFYGAEYLTAELELFLMKQSAQKCLQKRHNFENHCRGEIEVS